MSLITSVFNVSKNLFLNGIGASRDLEQLLKDKDVDKALEMFENNDEQVAEAIKQYDPEQHEVMSRPNKARKNRVDYVVQKLPRAWQRYINEVALFFLLAKPIRFQAEGVDDNESLSKAFKEFKKFLDDTRFNANMRKFKRMAGAEGEAAKLYQFYNDNGKPAVKCVILSRKDGYYLRPLFDQFKNMVAFGYGYYLKEGSTTVEHFDIQTPSTIYRCVKGKLGWDVEEKPNPTGKINIIYASQPVEWDGAQRRIHRDEMNDSKTADTNEYFADPIAMGTAGALAKLTDPESVGKLIILPSKDDTFGYVEPPSNVEMKRFEKDILRTSILNDSFTPDLTYEGMKGMGTLSGEALRRALILGYMKRDNRMEIYDELVDREINLILTIMSEVLKINVKDLVITHEFAEPFDEDTTEMITRVSNAYAAGVLSLEQAVSMLGFAKDAKKEVEQILADRARKTQESAFPSAGLE